MVVAPEFEKLRFDTIFDAANLLYDAADAICRAIRNDDDDRGYGEMISNNLVALEDALEKMDDAKRKIGI